MGKTLKALKTKISAFKAYFLRSLYDAGEGISNKTLKKLAPAFYKGNIPQKEQWLYKNKKALRQVLQGLQDSDKGKVKSRG